MIRTERPFSDGRPSAVFVFNGLRTDGGRLTSLWLDRLRAFDAAGWAVHAALVNRDAGLAGTVGDLVTTGRLAGATQVHHYAARDRRLRPLWGAPVPPGGSIDPVVGDWLDWLTIGLPGAVVVADSPAAYPYVAAMTNPLVARVAGIHLNHLGGAAAGTDPALAPMTPRFAERFEPCASAFDALVVMTRLQAEDLRTRLGQGPRIVRIPPSVRPPAGPAPGGAAAADAPAPLAARRIVAVGPLQDGSRHDDALVAVAPALLADPGLVLEVVGEGDGGPALVALAERLGVADRLRIMPATPDEHSVLRGAALALWTGRRESCPLAIIRSLAVGVPVVAYDVRYGPADLLAEPTLGTLVPSGDVAGLERAVRRRLAAPHEPAEVLRAAGPTLAGTHPDAVGAAWVGLAEELSAGAHPAGGPALVVERMSTTSRVLGLPGILAAANADPPSWTLELPGLVEPTGWVVPAPGTGAGQGHPDGDGARPEPATDGAGGVQPVVVHLRTNALAHVATGAGEPFRLDLTDGTRTIPLHSTGFQPRVVASRVGIATLARHVDGTMWVTPATGMLAASVVEGRVIVRLHPEGPASDVTHAVDWTVGFDWADLSPTPGGVSLVGVLRATGIAPAADSTPSICVTDAGGYSRVVGALHLDGDPEVDRTSWSVAVSGVLEADALAATTQLARGPLALHVGFRGLIVPVGSVRARGRPVAVLLYGRRGHVTLVPAPGGRVLAAPGRGHRTRLSVAVRSLVGRAGPA